MTRQLTQATVAYQQLLEAHRALGDHDPHELVEDVTDELLKARAAMEIAWLKASTA